MFVKRNFHTHTSRCGHADGADEEFVLSAIRCGYKIIGFSDHIFLPGINQKGIRGNYELLDEYVNSLKALKEKYKDQIDIRIGFEAEYYPKFEQYYNDLLFSNKVDYMILGQHCFYDDNNNELIFYNSYHGNKEMMNKYVDDLIAGMSSGLFSYVAHPDLYMAGYGKWDKAAIEAAHRICRAAKKYGLALEINLAGVRHFRNTHGIPSGYPFDAFWEVVKKYDIDVVIGVDAHNPGELASSQNIGFEIARINKLNIIDDIKMFKEMRR